MTTEPSAPRPQATTSRPAVTARPANQQAPHQTPQTRQRVVTVSSPGPLIGAIVTLFLGILLGVANQGAHGTGMGLRVPALLAALLMTGQGVVDIKRHLPKRRIVEESDTLLVDDGSGSGPRATELAVVRQLPPQQPVSVAVRPTAPNLAVPITVMVLAAWLGLADLRVAAPTSLMILCLIASFALFALGWSLLPARR